MEPRRPPESGDELEHPTIAAPVWYGALAVCALLGVADLFYPKHVHYAFESWFGAYAIYGFASCVFIIVVARQLRRVGRRDEDYYD